MSPTPSARGSCLWARKDQRGQALPLALIVLAVGTLLVSSFLTMGTTSILGSGQAQERLQQRTAADAGLEHAIWRVRYDGGFISSLPPYTPVAYARTIGGVPVGISVTLIPTPTPLPTPTPAPTSTPQPGQGVQVGKLSDPLTAVPNRPTVFTYTIQVVNTGTSTVHLNEISDLLPPGFTYVSGSSSGITSAEPVLTMEGGRQKLRWTFQTPLPEVRKDETGLQVFQAAATPQDGVYYNEAWVLPEPETIGLVGTGSAAPVVIAMPQYDIRVTAGPLALRSRVGIQDGAVRIRSWQEE